MPTTEKKFCIAFAAAILFCNPLSNDHGQPPDLPHPGMKKVQAAGKLFSQGWNDALASLDEKPGMVNSFSYDYWLDSTEVTQGRFYELTGRKPVADTSCHGAGDPYPVYCVTWFDAALFCNARSRAEGLDTVYVYFGVKALPGGTVYELTGLRCDVSRDGYRLPTESEWEFVAREGSSKLPFSKPADSLAAAEAAWYAGNAANATHPAGTKRPNSLGLYDMAGNVFEWTNDWKCRYDGKSVTNSLGAFQPGAEYEKVIKGGSYNFGMSYLRPSHRSATYATILSSANEYVGFRCARGAIPDGRYIGTAQGNFATNPVNIVAGGAAMRAFTGASESKLVFVNVTDRGRTLCCVDYSAPLSFAREFMDDTSVYMPSISPDGRFAAYCGANEGQTGPSVITVRSLDSLGSPRVRLPPDTAYIPRWWVDRSSGDTCIVYTNSAIINGNPLWKSTSTFMQTMRGGRPVGAPRVVIPDGSYHDGISVDKRYAVTGNNRLLTRDLITNEEKHRFLSPHNGKDATGSTQVCNVSVSPDTGAGARCLFLDFGYPGTSTVTGCGYGVHEYLFVSSFSDTITNYLRRPPGEQSWENPEWSNRARFAVACCRNSADRAHAIYVIDLDHHGHQPVVTGTELQQPSLWVGRIVENPLNLALDSLGAYNDPSVDISQNHLAYGLHYFWKRRDELDVMFIGNSLVCAGIDCSKFLGHKALSLVGSGIGLQITSQLIRNYVLIHARKVKVIGINIPFYVFSYPSAEITPDRWNTTLGQSKGCRYDRNHDYWRDGLPQGFAEAAVNAPYPDMSGGIDTFGLAQWESGGWGGPNPGLAGTVKWSVDDPVYQANLAAFIDLIGYVSARKVHLLAVNFPESPYFKATDHYLHEGPSWETAKAVLARIMELQKEYPYFHVYDAYNGGNHDYTDQDAHDCNHLCPAGAAKLSERLSVVIDSIIGHAP